MIIRCKKLLSSQRGSAIIIVSIAAVALIGFCSLVVDMGSLFLARHRLSNALDAAVLAACQELPDSETGALYITNEYFSNNKATSSVLTGINVTADKKVITATGKATVEYALARVLGINTATIQCKAAARIEPVTGVKGVVPLGIKNQSLQYGTKYTLKISSNSNFDEYLGPGNFGVLQLDGSGSSNYESYFKDGYSGKIEEGDILSTESGNKSGATRDGINHRVAQCTHQCTPDHFDPACPRVIIIPVYEPEEPPNPQPGDKITKVRIIGFATFLIDLPGDKTVGNECYVEGWFVQMVIEGDSEPGGHDLGAYTARLIK